MVRASGWQKLGPDPDLAAWAAAALPMARRVIAQSDEAWRCGGTWFVGVDALPNDARGGIGGVALPWGVLPLTPVALHPAQLSTIRPGYPQPSSEESAAAFAFRRDRDAAHLDGLLPFGPDKRRRIAEPHGWILGIALNACGAGASPLVVWEGSHLVMQQALRAALAPHPPETWADVDVTDAYQAARREVFATCRRITVPIQPGEATLLHRHLIHGVAPWEAGAEAPEEGRIIAYFRPELPSVAHWMAAD
jgi:hypothetical protein